MESSVSFRRPISSSVSRSCVEWAPEGGEAKGPKWRTVCELHAAASPLSPFISSLEHGALAETFPFSLFF